MLSPGDQIGGYVVEREIGDNGLCCVFLARQLRGGLVRVLKVGRFAGGSLRRRVWLEGEVLSTLRHPNIVTLHEALVHCGYPVLVLECVGGTTLDAVLATGGLPFVAVDPLAEGLFAGLAAAHLAGVVHRDLRPANVFLAPSPAGVEPRFTPKIAGFGLAMTLGSKLPLAACARILGTPRFMAPEHREPHPVDGRADVFSLGCILYEMIAGIPAFPGDDPDAVAESIASGSWIPLPELRPDTPARMVDTVHACLQARRQDRPANCGEARRRWGGELETVLWAEAVNADSTVSTAPVRTHVPPRKTAHGTPPERPPGERDPRGLSVGAGAPGC